MIIILTILSVISIGMNVIWIKSMEKKIETIKKQGLSCNAALRNDLKEVKSFVINNREIAMDKTEEIKQHITIEKNNLYWKQVNTPVRMYVTDGNSKKKII